MSNLATELYMAEFHKSCNNIEVLLQRALDMAEHSREQAEKWNRDDEIQKQKDETKRLLTHSLLVFTDKECERHRAFLDAHYKKCGNGNKFVYTIIETGIGPIIKVKCPICGEEEDITDSESW